MLAPRFDAGIIANELKCAGLHELLYEWKNALRNGFCTMDPYLGKWITKCFGTESKDGPGKHTMRLQALLRMLVPGNEDLKRRQHTAGADAQLHRLLLIALSNLAKKAEYALNTE